MSAYKIGVLSKADMEAVSADTFYDDSAYSNNPADYPDLLVNTRYPYNAEARLSQLTDNWQTPIGRHFVRNHSAVPDIDPDEYLLTIEGEGVEKTTFTLNDLKTKFKKVDVTTVIQCNGNRREDFHYLDGKTPSFGPPHWVAGAIGNATWSGVRLRDVLRASGMDVDAISLRRKDAPAKATQIGLLGYDHDEVGNQYCCSFPFDKAIDSCVNSVDPSLSNDQFQIHSIGVANELPTTIWVKVYDVSEGFVNQTKEGTNDDFKEYESKLVYNIPVNAGDFRDLEMGDGVDFYDGLHVRVSDNYAYSSEFYPPNFEDAGKVYITGNFSMTKRQD